MRDRKAANLRTAAAALRHATTDDLVELDERTALAVVVALTDVRLVLGERLGLRHDEDVERLEVEAAELEPEEPFAHAVAVYDLLTWLQETLAGAMRPVPGGGHVARHRLTRNGPGGPPAPDHVMHGQRLRTGPDVSVTGVSGPSRRRVALSGMRWVGLDEVLAWAGHGAPRPETWLRNPRCSDGSDIRTDALLTRDSHTTHH